MSIADTTFNILTVDVPVIIEAAQLLEKRAHELETTNQGNSSR
jgi:hypothetical protein